jgi:hypothetical protein
MASKNLTQLAQILHLPVVEKGGPIGNACVSGAIDGFPIAIAWANRQKQSSVAFLLRWRKGSLSLPAEVFTERVAGSPEALNAMGRKKISGAEKGAIAAVEDGLVYFWDYSFRGPAPETVAAVLRALLALVKASAAPVGNDCEVCGSARTGELCSVGGALMSVCSGCRQRMEEEDRRAVEEYAMRPANPMLGTVAGIAAAIGGALLWGGVAYSMNKIFLWGGLVIGLGVAWAVNKGMGKVNLYGRGLTVVLTIASVLGGDFFFVWLSAANELNEPATLDLAARLLPHFFEIEFSDASGYLSVLFGVLGAVYILFVNRSPSLKRVLVPIGRATIG